MNAVDDTKFAFVIMPFDASFNSIYDQLIRQPLERAGYKVERADSNLNQRNIIKDIIKKIDRADLIVADLTTLNKNVMYELGIAHALLKPTVMVIQDIEQAPFDLAVYTLIPYSTVFDRISEFQDQLYTIGVQHKANKVTFENPVSDFAESVTKKPHIEKGVVALEKSNVPVNFLEITSALNERTMFIAEEITAFGRQMVMRNQSLDGKKFPEDNDVINHILYEVGGDILRFAQQIQEELEPYEKQFEFFLEYIDNLIVPTTTSNETYRIQMRNFRPSLEKFQVTLATSTQSISNLRQTLSRLSPVTAHLKRAIESGVNSLDALIRILIVGDSSITRMIGLISQIASENGED